MLDSIQIKNFRSCDDVHLDLSEPVIALLGKNGAGKTNLLHAIQHVADLCVGESEFAFSYHSRDLSKPMVLSLQFTLDADRFEYQYSILRPSLSHNRPEILTEFLTKNDQVVFNRNGEEIAIPDPPSSSIRMRIGFRAATVPTLLQILPTDSDLVRQLEPVSAFLSSVSYYPLLQGFHEHVINKPSVGDRFGDSSGIIEAARYEAWKSELLEGRPKRSVQMRLIHLHRTDPDTFHELRTLLGENGLGLFEGIHIEEVRLSSRSPQKGASFIEGERELETAYIVLFRPARGIAGAGRSFQYSGLSAGTLRVLQLITYLVFDKSSCMLLEQPEDSIHAGLLSKLIDILKSYSHRTQLICTSHSPCVINLVGSKGIRLVTAVDGRTSTHGLSEQDMQAAEEYLQDEGTLAEFLDTI